MFERTLVIVKPAAFARGQADAILARAEAEGLAVVRRADGVQLTLEQAEAHYVEHAGRPHFARITADLASGPVTLAVLDGVMAVAAWRRLLGPSDPAKAEPGTIRRDFGTVLPDNAAHGSDGPAAAVREEAILFGGADLARLALRMPEGASITIEHAAGARLGTWNGPVDLRLPHGAYTLTTKRADGGEETSLLLLSADATVSVDADRAAA